MPTSKKPAPTVSDVTNEKPKKPMTAEQEAATARINAMFAGIPDAPRSAAYRDIDGRRGTGDDKEQRIGIRGR